MGVCLQKGVWGGGVGVGEGCKGERCVWESPTGRVVCVEGGCVGKGCVRGGVFVERTGEKKKV